MVETGAAGAKTPLRIGNTTDYVEVDIDNHAISVYINGAKVHEWS